MGWPLLLLIAILLVVVIVAVALRLEARAPNDDQPWLLIFTEN